MGWLIGVAIATVLLAVLLGIACNKPLRRFYRQVEIERTKKLFVLQRERLEAKFLDLARSSGKPKGLFWEDGEFHSPICFVRDKNNGQLGAFVGVTIRFSAIEDEGMEEVEAVVEPRNATAIFHCHHGQWGSGGKVLFNMEPQEAIIHFQDQFEPVSSEQ